MKLLLTSSGLHGLNLKKEFLNLLEKKPFEVKMLVIHTALSPEHLVYVNQVGKELVSTGILRANVDFVNISSRISISELSKYVSLYVCGGNTFFILERMRKCGLDVSIKKFVKRGGLYVGVSAGSIIVGKSIEIAGWGSEGDPNDIRLKNLKGLNLTDFTIFPHYKTKLKKEVDDFRKKVNYSIEPIRDGEAILVKNSNVKKVKG